MADNPRYTVTISPKRGGVPIGGTTGQVLKKLSNGNWDSDWANESGSVTVTQNKLLGRGASSGTGSAEEITLGTNLSLTGTTLNASGGGSAGGSNSQVQYNNAGAFGGITNATTNGTTLTLTSPSITTPTGLVSSDVGLGNVTNNAQTQAAIVPNTAPTAGQILVGNAGGTAYAKQTLSGSGATATLGATGVLTLSAIPNATLSNSAITIAGTSTSLGGSITQDTITGLGSTGLVKRTGANTLAIATVGTDYGTVSGPGSATDLCLVWWDGTTGKLVASAASASTAPMWSPGGELDIYKDNAVTNAANVMLTLNHTTSGTPAAGIGSAMEFTSESLNKLNDEAALIAGVFSDVGVGTATSYIDLQVRNSGAALASKARLFGSGGLSVNSTTDPGAGQINANTGFKVGGSALNFTNLAGFATTAQAGVKTGGTTGQVLAKNSNADYDLVWNTVSGTGTVTSVAATSPILASPSPIVGAGTLSLDMTVDHSFAALQTIRVTDAATTTTTFPLLLDHQTSGTAANGFGTALNVNAESASGTDRNIGNLVWSWTDATDATRTAKLDINICNSPGSVGNKVAIFGSGGMSVNNTTDPGAGIISANTGYWVGTAASSSGKLLQSDGAAFRASTMTWPSGSAPTSRKIVVSDGTNMVASTETYAVPGTSGNVLTSDGTNWTSAAPSGGVTDEEYILGFQGLGSGMKASTLGIGPANLSSSAFTMVDAQLQLIAIYLQKAATITGVKWYQSANGSYTGDQNNKVGLYTYSGGTLTLVASSTNDANLWQQGASAIRNKAFSSTYAASAGLFFVGLLYNNSAQTTAPTIAFASIGLSANLTVLDFTNSAKWNATLAAQTDLPTPQAMSGTTSSSSIPWVFIY